MNCEVVRLVDVLPNGPAGHPTVRVFLAGGVPEVMLHLRGLGLLDLTAPARRPAPPSARSCGSGSPAKGARVFRRRLRELDGIDPDEVIHAPEAALRRGLTSTITFCRGNLAPEGSVVKSTAIDPHG